MNPGKKLNSIHERHIDVGQKHVNFLFFEHLQRFLSIGGLQNILPDIHPRKQHPNALSLYHFIIYNQICVHASILFLSSLPKAAHTGFIIPFPRQNCIAFTAQNRYRKRKTRAGENILIRLWFFYYMISGHHSSCPESGLRPLPFTSDIPQFCKHVLLSFYYN